jgi:SP family general alpha glucoside:H+ symporter-like MFS transporter
MDRIKPQLFGNFLGIGQSLGNIIGIGINSVFTEKFGHKKVLLVSYISMIAFVFILFFAPSIQTLFAGQLLIGILIGIFSVTAVGYTSEITPVVLRGYVEVYVLLCWATGQLISTAVNRGFAKATASWHIRFRSEYNGSGPQYSLY